MEGDQFIALAASTFSFVVVVYVLLAIGLRTNAVA